MASSDEKLKRSLKLCYLINERNVDSEVGAEIRKLLIEGVDINFQDLNHNGNTPLHLAAQKDDINCVRLLLKYKPNLQIKNKSNRTPFDASSEIKELLSSANFDLVDGKFVSEIPYQNLTLERLQCLETDSTLKVLKITSCPSVQVVWEKIIHEDFRKAIDNLPHLFIIAIETPDTKIKILSELFDTKRPMIFQITSNFCQITKIYYKEENATNLLAIECQHTIEKREFEEKIRLGAFCNLPSLVQGLNSNVFGTFSGSLLDVKLNNDESRSEIVNCFAKANTLCHRFFKLFHENLTENELSARVTNALKLPGDQSMLAVLDLPFELNDEVELTDGQKRILNLVDSRNYNLLMNAIECNNNDAVKTLQRFPIDLGYVGDNCWASDLCWEKQHWECLAELIEAGSPVIQTTSMLLFLRLQLQLNSEK